MADALKARYERAKLNRDSWNNVIDTAIKYIRPSSSYGKVLGANKGKVDGQVFDSTAPDALNKRVASIQSQLFPLYQPWISFESVDGADKNEQKIIKEAADKAQLAITKSNFYTEIDQVLAEATISVGAIIVRRGDDANPLIFEAISLQGLIPEESSDGYIRTVFFKYMFTKKQIISRYSSYEGYKPPDYLKDDDTKLEIVEGYVYDEKTKHTVWHAWVSDNWTEIVKIDYAVSPIITARERKAPGEVMGRGRVLDFLPDIVSLNGVSEMTLDNAALAIGGVWQADDDGTLNIDNITFEPRAIIPKAVFSKGLQPLQTGRAFDVSSFVISDIQEKIRRGILGDELPTSGDRRTAYEYSVRVAKQQSIEVPMNMRILQELHLPLVKSVLNILSDSALANSPFYVGELSDDIELMPSSPVVRLVKAVQVSQENSALLGALEVFTPELVYSVIKPEKIVRRHLEMSGFPIDDLKTDEELKKEVDDQKALALTQALSGGAS